MADEPPNPYQPSAFLSDGDAKGAPSASPAASRRPSRAGAILASLFLFLGAGLYILNRPRRFAGWLAAALAASVLAIVAARGGHAKLFAFAFVAVVVIWLAALTDTAIARPGAPRTLGHTWAFLSAMIAVSVGSSLAVKHWVVEAFRIPSGSMVPALLVGDHVFVKKGRGDVARGDVVVFEFPADRRVDYIKRVLAIGGDRLEIKDGVPSINGVPLAHEPLATPCEFKDDDPRFAQDSVPCKFVRETLDRHTYTIMFTPDRPAGDTFSTVVPPGELFVVGDNRDNSYDSRRWGFVPADHIKGKPNVIWWSSDRAGVRWPRIGQGVE